MANQDQCGPRQFFFSCVDPNRFAYPQTWWPFLPGSFILYRILLAGYQVAAFTLVLLFWGEEPYYSPADTKTKWFIYVSNWGYLATVLYAVWTALTTIYWHVRGERQNNPGYYYYAKEIGASGPSVTERRGFTPRMTWYFKVTWFLQVIACSSIFATTVFFWLIGEFADFNVFPEYYDINFFTLNVHGVALALMTVDFLVSANPCRILHLIYPALFGFLYYVFTYAYHELGGLNPEGDSPVYNYMLDWKGNPVLTALFGILVVVVVCPQFHVIFFLLYLLKVAFGKCCLCCIFKKPGDGRLSS